VRRAGQKAGCSLKGCPAESHWQQPNEDADRGAAARQGFPADTSGDDARLRPASDLARISSIAFRIRSISN
jgi:hypothetical protein